jgi:pantetheine-phosphate adenylyltransferase
MNEQLSIREKEIRITKREEEVKKIYNKGAIGGTFDLFHVGHEKFLSYAAKVCKKLIVGVTSDDFAKKYKTHQVESFNERVENVKKFLKNFEKETNFEIVKLEDKYGPAIEDKELEALFVTINTLQSAIEINRIRKEVGLNALEIVILPLVLAEDGKVISSTRIRAGEIDRNGKKATKRLFIKQ